MALATVGYSLPSFVSGLALIYIFAVWLQILPSSGNGDARHLIMPVAVSGSAGAAALARFTRSAMLDVLGQPYILAARASGVPRQEIIWRHAIPNAAIPIVTFLGFAVGGLVGGAIVVETVFAWPGLGSALAEAVGQSDLTIVQTMVLLFGLVMVVANLIVDLLYGFLNPKIRLVRDGD
jgi:peptide/nickel transport system permease protein